MAVRFATLMICLLLSPALVAAQGRAGADSLAADSTKIEELERRIRDLEQTRAAQEEATRAIIRQTIDQSGTRINNVASFGGVFEMLGGYTRDFAGIKERVLRVSGMELVFEVQMSEWTLGNFVVQYNDGQDVLFPTTMGTDEGVPRFDLDTGYLLAGDTQRFPLYATFGRIILPFGISTGDPVADVPTIEDPLTIEAFEFREDALLLGIALPTPAPKPTVSVLAPTPVKPKVLRPLIGGLARLLGYRPQPVVPTGPNLIEPVAPPPPVNLAVHVYRGNTVDPRRGMVGTWHPGQHWGATAGFRNTGPWAVDLSVDYNSSVFDSRFLEAEYGGIFDEIGLVPGMAGSLKAKLGPVGFVSEWNGAIREARFRDDLNRNRVINPRAWQLGLVYQLGWNSGVESLGAQGTYLAAGYSRSLDLAGYPARPVSTLLRLGALPQERFIASAGEWVADGLRVAFEYSHIRDYRRSEGGTGKTGWAVLSMITYDW
jgi:hypothetical protein